MLNEIQNNTGSLPFQQGLENVEGQNDVKSADPTDAIESIEGINFEFICQQNTIFETLFEKYPTSIGKSLSKRERQKLGKTEASLVYGEIKFETLGICLEKIKMIYGQKYNILQSPGGIFYDIGSGTGKPVFSAALLHDFVSVCGIEILEGLHVASLEVLKKWNNEIKSSLEPSKQETDIQMIQGDATDPEVCDWSNGDVIFLNSTCFDDKLMKKIGVRAEKLKVGAIVISLTQRLPSNSFEVLESKLYQMSWGKATVYIQQKIFHEEDNE